YRKEAPLNYCPSCKTVLADEQVIDGKCERCGTEVETRKMSQWFFRITKYAGKLLENTYKIDWPEKVLIGQRNWIGKSTGSQITFKIQGRDIPIEVFTTRIDTVYGVTAIVIAPDTSLPMEIATSNQKQAVTNYIKNSRPSDRNEKTGVFTGAYAINPFSSELIPIWVGNYVVGWYGTGAVMVVPGHDERDFEFANKYDLPVKRVIKTKQGDLPSTDYGVLVDSGEFSGLSSKEAILAMNKYLEDTGSGKGTVQYKLRDWIISRQRYWGAPIPMIYCSKCDWQPVPEKDLPVLLPEVEDYQPKGKGKSPLALVDDFVYTACPNCGGPAERETDVCDTFLDSAWYFLRYPSVKNTSDGGPASGGDSSEVKEVLPWDPEITRKWLPVTKYIGGAEHTVLHLLYSRFVVMALKDLGYLDFNEPFPSFFAHGLIIKEGAKMSKSKGNVVVPDEYIKKYGSDSLRTYLMFLGPYDAGGDFRDSGMFGMFKFIRRIWNLFHFIEKTGSITSIEVKVALYKTIKKATGDIPKFKFNTTIASFMEFTNVWEKDRNVISQEDAVSFLKILAPFMPHMTEEIYQKIKNQKSPASLREAWRAKIKIEEDFQSIHIQNWPVYDEKLLVEDKVNIVVQVNGKLRAQVVVPADKASDREYVIEEVSKNKIVKKYVNDKLNAKKIIFVPKRLVNFVI
ncbi:leucine--tRNA ligase, partial [Candidatus Gottesmanbacteria bacterium]|nr:leucine--tRNA ligase [Candidatus Gottesmanbacteria bacterium]